MAVHSAVLKGWKEMPEMTHADTLGMARTFDVIRVQAAAKAPVAATLEQVPPCRFQGSRERQMKRVGVSADLVLQPHAQRHSNQCRVAEWSVCCVTVQGMSSGNIGQKELGGNPVSPGAARNHSSASLNHFAGPVDAAALIEPATAA